MKQKWLITYAVMAIDFKKPKSVIVEAPNRPKAISQLKNVIHPRHYKECTIIDCVKVYEG